MAVAANAQRWQLHPGDVATGSAESVAPPFHRGPRLPPERMLVEMVAPDKEMRHVREERSVARGRIGCAGGLERDHRAHTIRGGGRRGEAEIAALAVGEHDGAAVHALEQIVVGALRQGVVAAPARHALKQEGVKAPGRKTQAGMRAPQRRIGVPGAGRAETERLLPGFLRGAEIGGLRVDLGIRRPGRTAAFDRIRDIGVVASAKKKHLPAGPPVRRRLPVDAGHAAAVPQQQRHRRERLRQTQVLNVHLPYHDLAIGVDRMHRAADGADPRPRRQPFEPDHPAADMEARRSPGSAGQAGLRSRHKLPVRLVDEQQHGERRHVEAERRVLPVPDLRLPHREPFAAHHHEAGEPEQECHRHADDGEPLRAVECRRIGAEVAQQRHGAGDQQRAGQAFRRDDQDVAGVPGDRLGDRAIQQGVARKRRVHRQHVLHEGKVRGVVRQVVERHDEGECGEGADHRQLGAA